MKNYIDFKSAKCRDCYLCLKNCPVKAIMLVEHQARIIPDRCIQCGLCTEVCPQNAKSPHSELLQITELLASGKQLVASVAPSFISSFNLESFSQMQDVLSRLGFSYAEETAVGAVAVTEEYAKLLRSGEYKNLISSACPAVNRLIQIYYPEALKYLAPVDSPMSAHAKMLKERFPDAKVVFVGPCIAKMREADETPYVDHVLTFDELLTLMFERELNFPAPQSPRAASSGASARRYPTGGGIIKSFINRPKSYEYVAVDTVKKCREVLKNVDTYDHIFIELNACSYGCINGPCALVSDDNAVSAENRIRKYAASSKEAGVGDFSSSLAKSHPRIFDISLQPSEEEIRAILAKTGKFKPEDELNCGACGYSSCREKAWAVHNGFAGEDVCIPYMRSKAESVSSEVMRRIPFGVIVLNDTFNIESINRSAMNMLGIDAFHPEGQQLFDFVSLPDFVIAQATDSNILNKSVEIDRTGKVLQLSVILLREHNRLLGIFKDITEENSYNQKLREVQLQTYAVTDEVVKKQMRIAQEIASLLGETTAETKVALLKLKELMQDDEL